MRHLASKLALNTPYVADSSADALLFQRMRNARNNWPSEHIPDHDGFRKRSRKSYPRELKVGCIRWHKTNKVTDSPGRTKPISKYAAAQKLIRNSDIIDWLDRERQILKQT